MKNIKPDSQIKAAVSLRFIIQKDQWRRIFSSYLSNACTHEYTALSKLFSSVEESRIESNYSSEIEQAKGASFIMMNMSLARNSFHLDLQFSATSLLQFKKETGTVPHPNLKNKRIQKGET